MSTLMMGRLPGGLELMRPWQWGKNIFVLAPLPMIITRQSSPDLWRLALLLVGFCLASSSVYVINDLVDRDADRRHPTKRFRPIASGRVSLGQAWLMVIALTVSSCIISPWIVLYLAISHAYSLRGKHTPYLDVLLVGSLYSVRVMAGFAMVGLLDSASLGWIVAAGLLSTAIEIGKRYAELQLLGSQSATRPVLAIYTQLKLQRFFAATTAATVLVYVFAAWGYSPLFAATVILVIAGMHRYWQQTCQLTRDAHPQDVIFGDLRLRFILGVFVLSFVGQVLITH